MAREKREDQAWIRAQYGSAFRGGSSLRRWMAAFACIGSVFASPVSGSEPRPCTAEIGAELALAAARAWADDAELVYVENDETLDASGSSPRWGYLFRSDSLERSRGYSVNAREVVQAADLLVRFEAPPLGRGWIDSAAALAAADAAAGAKFRIEEGGEPVHMVLMRGATDPKEPEQISWLVVYRTENRPSLFVLVDAVGGKVHRTWRG